jgi:hypothetical protein
VAARSPSSSSGRPGDELRDTSRPSRNPSRRPARGPDRARVLRDFPRRLPRSPSTPTSCASWATSSTP